MTSTKLAEGGCAFYTKLSAQAAADMRAIQAKTHDTKTAIIERLLRRAAARIGK